MNALTFNIAEKAAGPMTREERLTRRAGIAFELGLLFTAQYWERKRDGIADASDAADMATERDNCMEVDWAEFARRDRELAAEFEARKVAA